MKVKVMVVLFLVNFIPATVTAFDLGGEKFDGSISAIWLSKYVISLGSVAHKKQVAQEELRVSHSRSGIYIGTWLSQSPNGRKDFGEEENVYVGKITRVYGLDVDAQYNFISVSNLGDLHEFYVGASHPEWPFYWKAHYLLEHSRKSPEGGFFQEFGVAPTLKLSAFPNGYQQAVRFDARLVVNHGAIGIDHGLTHAHFSVALPIGIGYGLTVSPEIRHQVVFSRFNDGKKGDADKKPNRTWGGITFSYKF